MTRLETSTRLFQALSYFEAHHVSVPQVYETSESGQVALGKVLSEGMDVEAFIKARWFFHDVLYRKSWPEQIKIIGDTVGPSQYFIPLVAWAWMAYTGWQQYIRVHRCAPVNLEAYIKAYCEADDLRDVHYKEF